MSGTAPIPRTELDPVASPLHAQARQDIEALRRWYARATDLFGLTSDKAADAEARRIYRRIFTPDARIRVIGATARPLQATGPDGWALVVTDALREYEVTQHLIGTQIVDIRSLTAGRNDAGEAVVVAGEAGMTSYLQAWHVWPDNRLRLVMGNYVDDVRFVPGTGWQLQDMTLVHMSSEIRPLHSG